MNRQLRMAGLVLVLGLVLGLGYWQQQGWAAGQMGNGLKQAGNKLKQLFSSSAGKAFSPAPRPALALTPAAPMATITVTSLGDGAANAANCPGANCRLRDAIAKAVADDTINFSVTGTITLNSGELVIGKNLTINGPGRAQLTISGNQANRVFKISIGVAVALNGLTIANGRNEDIIHSGGGIHNQGAMTLTNCTLSSNSDASDGGGINNESTLILTNCTLSGNSATKNGSTGGAIFSSGSLTITGCTLSNNSASNGGGIYNDGTLTLTNSTLSGNSATSGGGIFCFDRSSATITNSTLSGNTAGGSGGGINIYLGGATLINSTISGNSASASGGGIYDRGDYDAVNTRLFLYNCTITSNLAANGGGGIYVFGSVYSRNTIIAGNNATQSWPDTRIFGYFNTLGHNLFGVKNPEIVPTTGDQFGTLVSPLNPRLATLANNGGPTQTHRLLPGSPALNAGANCVLTNNCVSAFGWQPNIGFNLTTDQRGAGFNRQVGSAVDIGAFELQNDQPLLTVNPATLPAGAIGNAYNQTLSATGGSGNYSFSISSGLLPPGLTLSATGQISGTPTSGSSFLFTVAAIDNSLIDVYGTRTYAITIPSVCATAPSGLVDWWRAEGNANDAVGANHGTLQGSATISTAAEGQVGRAFKFDGTNGYVALPDNLFPFPTSGTGTTPFSFELWFKTGSGGVILGQQNVAPYNTAAGTVPAIYVGTDGKLRVEMFWNGAANPLASASTVNDNLVFHHLAVTYNGTQQIVYLDGQAMGSRAHTQTAYSASYKYQLGTGVASGWPGGSAANGGWFNFTGLIDELSLYDRALTAQEVQALYGAGNAGKCSSNTAPSFTPAAAISRQQGSPAGAAVTVGTVSGGQVAAGSLTVTQIAGGTATGITVTGITNTNGTITALVSASCTAISGTVRFQVSDGSLTGTGDLQVNVTANTAPTLTYASSQTVAAGSGLTITPLSGPSDNGTISNIVVQSQGTYTGTISVHSTTGVISLSNAAPAGTHTLTIRVTDNCGTTTDASVSLKVVASAASGFLYALHDTNGASNEIYGYQVDETTGALTLMTGFPVATGGQGSGTSASDFLAVDRANLRLYALNGGSRTISAFAIDPATGALTALPFSPIALPNGITDWKGVKVHPSGSPLLAVAGPAEPGGRVASFVVTATTATAAAGSPYDTGSASPFASAFSHNGNYFYTGGNSNAPFAGFSVNSTTGVLTALAGSPFSVSSTPTAFATDANGRLLMAQGADLTVFTTASGIPTGVTGNPFAAGLGFGALGLIHPNGYYFVVDRSNNKVGVFQIGGSGAATTLSPVSGSPFASGGTLSQAAALNQVGSFLFVAHGTSRNLTIFTVDPSTGIPSSPVTQAVDTLGTAGILNGLTYLPGSTLSLTPTSLPEGTINAAYSQALTASGGTTPYTFSLALGSLPNGLSLSSDGSLSGTPTQAGNFSFRVLVRDSAGATGGQNYSLTINCVPITITPTSLPGGAVGASYSQTLSASGGTGPYTFSLSAGSLPSGVTLNGAMLSGTLSMAGTYSFTITATDGNGCPGTQAYSVTVGCPTIDLTPTSLPQGTYNSGYISTTIAPTGGTAPYTFTVTGLPTGMTANANTSNVTISGTPTQSGAFNVVVKVTDAFGCGNGTNGRTYTLTINKATPVLTWNNPADIVYGTALSATQLNATANVAGTFTYTPVTGTVLNAGNGQTLSVNFTPTDTANYNSASRGVLLNVLKASLTVTVHNAFRNQGEANPSFSGSITGLRNGDVITATYSTTATQSTVPGTYPITATLNEPNNRLSNYQVTNNPGTLTILNNCGITINPATFVQASLAIPYAQSLSASPSGSYSFSLLAGTLPPGLQLTNLVGVYSLKGTPTTPGTDTFTIKAKKNNSTCEGARTYTMVIAPSVIPIAECIRNNGNGTYTAYFGYENSTGAPVTIPLGGNNSFSTGAPDRGQPTVFQVGRVTNAFTVTFQSSGSDASSWMLKGPDGGLRSALLTPASPTCP